MANNVSLSYPSSFYHQFFDRNGKPLTSGKLFTYIAGSSTPVVTYKTIGGGTESANRNTNPIILDMAGMAELVISTDTAYRFVLFDKNDAPIAEWDNVTAGGSEGGSSSNVYVEGTSGEIDVEEESAGLIRRFVISLSDSVKNAISNLSSSVNDIIEALYNKKDKQQPVFESGSTTKVPVSFAQDANGVLDIEFDDITFPDWTTAINNAVANCEKTLNKKNSVTGYESSTSAYPSIKAVVDFVNNALQNLGGKLITDNGNPFSDSNDLPSTTPYQGVTISDKDYAYVQGTGFAERWSASVSGSNVTWVQEYSINIPVFTPAQQDAIDSGATATKIGNYDSHIANATIHVTSTEKHTWNAKQNAIGDLYEIRSGAAAGATALQPNGNGSNVTSTFTAASSRTNISSGEKLSTIFGKIAKWFADLKSVAFSGSYNDLSNKPTIPAAANNGTLTIKQNGTSKGTFSANQSSNTEINVTDTTYESKSEASGGTAVSLVTTGEKYTWNHKQNALPTSGTPSDTFAINVSGSANKANYLIRAYVNKSSQTTKVWKKIATSKTFTSWDACSICFLYNHSGYQNELGLDSIVSVTIHTGDAGSLSNARIYTYSYRSASETQLVRIGNTNQYEVWVKVPTTDTNMYATILNSYGDWTINTDVSQTGQLTDDEFTAYKSSNPSVGTSYNYNVVKASKSGVGSTRLPIFANSDGTLSPMNIDEYYCWANPTPQWTDVMEMTVWYCQNQCNNEILGSVRRIELNSSHSSLCYLRVMLPELLGAGRYHFTLEFEITNTSGQNGTNAYGVLLLVPPTGYSGEPLLAECLYDSSGKAQSSLMNIIHIPPQGYTYRHKLYVDGHTYRVVKTM